MHQSEKSNLIHDLEDKSSNLLIQDQGFRCSIEAPGSKSSVLLPLYKQAAIDSSHFELNQKQKETLKQLTESKLIQKLNKSRKRHLQKLERAADSVFRVSRIKADEEMPHSIHSRYFGDKTMRHSIGAGEIVKPNFKSMYKEVDLGPIKTQLDEDDSSNKQYEVEDENETENCLNSHLGPHNQHVPIIEKQMVDNRNFSISLKHYNVKESTPRREIILNQSAKSLQAHKNTLSKSSFELPSEAAAQTQSPADDVINTS